MLPTSATRRDRAIPLSTKDERGAPHHLRRFPSGPARRRAHRRIGRLRSLWLAGYLLLVAAPSAYALHLIVGEDPAWGRPVLLLALGAATLGAAAFWLFTGAARMRIEADIAIDGHHLVVAGEGERPAAADLRTPDVTVTATRTRQGPRHLLRVRAGSRRVTVALDDPRVGQVRCAEDLTALADALAASPEPEGRDAGRAVRALVPAASPRPDDRRAAEDCVPYQVPRGPWDRVGAALWAVVFLAAGAALNWLAVDGYRHQRRLIEGGGTVSVTAGAVVDVLMFLSATVLGIGAYRLLVKPFRHGVDAYLRPRPLAPHEAPADPVADSHTPSPPRPTEAGPRSARFAEYPPHRHGSTGRRIAAVAAAPVAILLALAGPVGSSLLLLSAAQSTNPPWWAWYAAGFLNFGLPPLLYLAHGAIVRHHVAVNHTRVWLDGHRVVCEGPRGVRVGDLHAARVSVRMVRRNAVLYVPVDGWWTRYPILLTQGRTDTWRPVPDLHRLAAALRTSPHPAGRAAAVRVLAIAPLAPGERLPRVPAPSRPRVARVAVEMPTTVAGRGARAIALTCAAAFLVLVGLTAASQAGGRPYAEPEGREVVFVANCHLGPPIGAQGFGRLSECAVQLEDGTFREVGGGEFTTADINTRVLALTAQDGLGQVIVRADKPRDDSALPLMVFAMAGAALVFVQACRLVFRRP
ncbi:hypothetical protein Afil01_13350 [Actinorhabdospora filicis]|uniref:Uncharacterized protein n=1 Tax=Actinorhabdospora filicis TaxID=1785913 RepID=A0A9W6SIB6_9ACTN|nr:DUF6346 domain-containing protein [Actinorhabdospora filicis]GLZ76528.1 hypothetical protein Afil01_13350 [Actinorhabdospora filicis]